MVGEDYREKEVKNIGKSLLKREVLLRVEKFLRIVNVVFCCVYSKIWVQGIVRYGLDRCLEFRFVRMLC